MIQLVVTTGYVLHGLRTFLEQVDGNVYSSPLDIFSGSSIGQHSRHIIEFYQCLLQQHGTGIVNYDQRKRDVTIEYDPQQALAALNFIELDLQNLTINHPLILQTCYSHEGLITETQSSIERELVANIEHTIHHLALIKVALTHLEINMPLPAEFGIAPSTIRHRKDTSCAQ